MANLQQQVRPKRIDRRQQCADAAVALIAAAFAATPSDQHQQLLDDIYARVIARVFGIPGNVSHAEPPA
jgi:hypothetical protein